MKKAVKTHILPMTFAVLQQAARGVTDHSMKLPWLNPRRFTSRSESIASCSCESCFVISMELVAVRLDCPGERRDNSWRCRSARSSETMVNTEESQALPLAELGVVVVGDPEDREARMEASCSFM